MSDILVHTADLDIVACGVSWTAQPATACRLSGELRGKHREVHFAISSWILRSPIVALNIAEH